MNEQRFEHRMHQGKRISRERENFRKIEEKTLKKKRIAKFF